MLLIWTHEWKKICTVNVGWWQKTESIARLLYYKDGWGKTSVTKEKKLTCCNFSHLEKQNSILQTLPISKCKFCSEVFCGDHVLLIFNCSNIIYKMHFFRTPEFQERKNIKRHLSICLQVGQNIFDYCDQIPNLKQNQNCSSGSAK